MLCSSVVDPKGQRTLACGAGSQTLRGKELMQLKKQDSTGRMPASKAKRGSRAGRSVPYSRE